METEAEMSPRGQDSGVAAAAGSPERDVGGRSVMACGTGRPARAPASRARRAGGVSTVLSHRACGGL